MKVQWKYNGGTQLAVFLFIMSIPLVAAKASSNPLGLDGKFKQDGQDVAWTQKEFHNKPENFQFVIVSDRTSGFRPGVFESAVKKINLLQPEFVMSVGDFIEGYTHDVDVLERDWDEFERIVDALEMPFFMCPAIMTIVVLMP
ncbi:MAG: hypothetical protein DRH90_26010 [Deltaproteobacteria bacterium]|nr:MAG: hypothetical protein DRH90_26010 [Deltaproteobacteria bacterium]